MNKRGAYAMRSISLEKDRKLKKPKSFKKIRTAQLTIMTLPAMLFLIVFKYIPMCGLTIAFQNFRYDKGVFGSEFIGFKNFEFFFKSADFIRITRNTILYNLGFIVTVTIGAILLALLLYEVKNVWMIKFYQTSMFLPFFLSMVVVSYITFSLFSVNMGIANQIIEYFGGEPIQWYSEKKYWPFILIFVNFWKNIGYTTIIFYTGLLGIDSTYYEAAEIDGATKWQTIKKISVPMIMPLITMMVIMNIGKIFYADFGLFYTVTQNSGILYPVTDVIDTYVYRTLNQLNDVGMSAAVGFYQAVVGFVLVLASNEVLKKINNSEGIF